MIESTYKLVAPAGRLLRRVDGWPAAERSFAEDCAARTLGLGVAELRRAGLDALADAALAASTTAELAAVAQAAAESPQGEGGNALVARLIGYAVDCAWDIDNGYYTMCAYVAATAFANHSTGGIVQDMSSDGSVEERARQASWLADRFHLHDGG